MSAVTEARTRDPGWTIGVARVKCACTMFGCVCAEPCRTRTKVNISAEFAARTVRSTKGTDLICVLKNMIRKHPPAGIAVEEHPLSDCKIKVGASFLRGRYTKFANSLSETSPTATWPVHG